MSKVLLLNPPFYRLMGSHYNGMSLGLLYIAAVLRKDGHEAYVLNADYENKNDYLNQKEIFDNNDLYLKIHNNENHKIWKETVKAILEVDPDYLGITMFTANYKASQIIAKKVIQENPYIKIVVGGVHPTLDINGTLSASEFNYGIIGEGEYSFLQFVNGVSYNQIKGLAYKQNGEIIINQASEQIDLDSLPLPARKAIINDNDNTDFGQLITGRGCSFSCTFCAAPALWNRKVRFRSIENVIKELKHLHNYYPHKTIYFEDDTFTINPERTKALCQKIIDEELNITWKCDTRVDCISDDLVRLMKEAGCICIKLGMESGSSKILKQINKRIDIAKVLNAAKIIKKYNIFLAVYLMIGFPNETDADLLDTINFAKEINADYYSLSIVAPYYGTKLYDEYEIKNEPWEYFYHQNKAMIMNKSLSQNLIDEFLSLNEGKTRL